MCALTGLLVLTCQKALPRPLPVELAAGHEGAADGADELGLVAAARLEEAVEVPVLDEGEHGAARLVGGFGMLSS